MLFSGLDKKGPTEIHRGLVAKTKKLTTCLLVLGYVLLY